MDMKFGKCEFLLLKCQYPNIQMEKCMVLWIVTIYIDKEGDSLDTLIKMKHIMIFAIRDIVEICLTICLQMLNSDLELVSLLKKK